MARAQSIVRATAVILLAAGVTAQTRPDFSGKWTQVADAPDEAGARGGRGGRGTMGSGWIGDITLTQDATTLTIEYQPYVRYDMQQPIKLVYQLDGTESRNTINIGRGPQELRSKAVWEGSSLILTTVHSFKDPRTGAPATSETRQVLSLPSPTSLVVETTQGAALGGPASTTKTVYKK
jgi:hypothetical protein